MTNKIFVDPTTTIPREDPNFVRVSFRGSEIGGRQDHITPRNSPDKMGVKHVSTSK